MKNVYGVEINYVKSWRSREKALELTRGIPTALYAKLLFYLYLLKISNSGSILDLVTD